MKLFNPFFKKNPPILLSKIVNTIKAKNVKIKKKYIVDIKEINNVNKNEITFLNSSKYSNLALNTKASYCITNLKLEKFLPKRCIPLIVKNVLLSTAKVTEMFYPQSINDNFDNTVLNIDKTSYKNKLSYGKNVLIGKNVNIGKNCLIGHNTIIEKNVIIGKNCSIGSNVIIRNSLIGNNVSVLDGSVIGKNTFLDNQVHIAHNVKIGDNCMIAGQVGFAGSSVIGNNVMIGGQAGISGHLTIGDNVQIAGGSGVINDIPNNSKVMGYPAKSIKLFLKESR